jgi:phage terminase large subunit-like protein
MADALVAERNNGGEMVALTIGTIPGAPPVTLVWASRNKQTRAEPVQKLYQDGRVHHIDHFPQLELEQCTWQPGMDSPNRLDALVWCLTELLVGDSGELRLPDEHLADYLSSQFT